MANKISLVLSAVNQFSAPINAAQKSTSQLKSAVDKTNGSLRELNQKQRMVGSYKGLSNQLEETKQKLAGARVSTKTLKQAEIDATQAVKAHTASLRKAEKTVLSMAQAHGANSKQVRIAKKEVGELTSAKKRAEAALKRERSAVKTAEQAVTRLTSKYGQQAQKLGSLRRDMDSAGLKVKALGAEELRLAKKTKQANLALERQEKTLKKVQGIQSRINARNAQKGELVGQAIGTAAKVLPLAMAGAKSVSYEEDFADVKKVVEFSSTKEAEQYKRQMLQLAGTLGVDPTGIAQIVTAAGQSGIEKDQLLQFADSATRMSVAWDVSAEEAGSTLATWRASLGLTQKKALDLADATNYLSNNMNAKAKQIAGVMVREGSTAMGAGLGENDAAALAASLIAGGAGEERASTAMKNISLSLTSGFSATKSQQDAFSRLGFDAEELATAMQEDAQGTLIDVMRELQDVSEDERGALISQLFGKEITGAVSKLVQTLDDPSNGLIAAFDKVADSSDRAGSVNAEYESRAKTRRHTLNQIESKFDRMVITIGDRLLPAIDAVAPPLMTVIDGITEFTEANPELATGLLAVASAIAVVKAGAIAFKLAQLTLGNASDRFKLGKTKLTGSTNQTEISANRASKALDRFNRKLNGVGGAGSGAYEGGRRKGRRNSRRRSRGKYGRLAGLLGSGAALSMLSSTAEASDLAMAGADIAGVTGSVLETLPAGGAMLRGAGKVFRPLDIALQGAGLASAVANGNSKQIGATAGDMAGGLGGAALGASLGTAILPGVGTVIGGALGSLAGGELGSWIGDKIGEWFSEDKTSLPVPKEIVNQSRQLAQNNKQVTFSPVIHITPSGNPNYDQQVGDELINRMKSELTPVLLGSSDLSIHSDASLTDRSDL